MSYKKNNPLTPEQSIQENQYNFPYHYFSSSANQRFTQTYNWTWGLYYQSTLDFLLDKLHGETFNSIIDIGCGDGRLVRELHDAFSSAIVEGVDYSEQAISLARLMNPSVTFNCRDIIRDKTQQRFDRGTLIEVLEHIPDELVSSFLESIREMLADDGVLLLTVPHVNQPLNTKHFRHYTIETLTESVTSYFHVDEVVHFQRTCRVATLIHKLLTNRFFILNHEKWKRRIYDYYRNHCFFANGEKDAQRIFVRLIKKK
jgi:2-polyprenyl-3-methyl-5-hydroxy-6-metoxy-1,4-benzoquinol methylase